ncbi:MAG: dynamin family protein [Sulfurospirillum sp.]|nr:dynamin family protein [Sulfurospirillum sp.]
MSKLAYFIQEFKDNFVKNIPVFDANLLGLLERVKFVLLDESMSASLELKEKLAKLQIRAKEPMKVAIVGQFSSGKSTFLNAILAQNILPTGITPVTSKINYIKYANELMIKVTYLDGSEKYHDIKDIAKFTDQRGEVEQIAYLSLYAPLEILKEITFVDTPGLNSQDTSDTQTTQKVLKEVDGIIWLSLMDNAGKMSEARVLEQFLGEYQNKSLCVLNQKDKFTPQEVAQSLSYVEKSFAAYFAKVVAISAKMALDARSHDKKILQNLELETFLATIKEEFSSLHVAQKEQFLQEQFSLFQNQLDTITQSDLSDNLRLQKESNIDQVLAFIQEEIRPKALQAKEFAIKKELQHLTHKLIQERKIFLKIYDDLAVEIENFEQEASLKLELLKKQFSTDLRAAYIKIEEIIDTIANTIFSHIQQSARHRYIKKKNRLLRNTQSYELVEFQAPKINADATYKELFYDDELVARMFKRYVKNLQSIQDEVNEQNALVYDLLKTRIRRWQGPHELLTKSDAIYSDIEFANKRKFASKAYENILKAFRDEVQDSYAKISSQFEHLSSAVSFNYQNATEVSVAFLEKKIEQSVLLYEQNPTKFSLYYPKLEEIKERLRGSFYLYELENMMVSKHSFLIKNYDRLKSEFARITQEKKEFIHQREQRHLRIIEKLNELLKQID